MTQDSMMQFLPIIGIAFSAFFAAFGYWFKLRFERWHSARPWLRSFCGIRDSGAEKPPMAGHIKGVAQAVFAEDFGIVQENKHG